MAEAMDAAEAEKAWAAVAAAEVAEMAPATRKVEVKTTQVAVASTLGKRKANAQAMMADMVLPLIGQPRHEFHGQPYEEVDHCSSSRAILCQAGPPKPISHMQHSWLPSTEVISR